MATIIFANDASSNLAGAITNVATTAALIPGTGALFPAPGADQYFVMTFKDAATRALKEIVHVTNVTGDVITMVRAQEGTSAQAWNAGDIAANLWTAGSAAAMLQQSQQQAQSTNYALDTGTTNAIACTLSPALTAHTPGMPIRVKLAHSNTGATTFNPGPGALPVINPDGSAVPGGTIFANGIYTFEYDSAGHYQLVSSSLSVLNSPTITNATILGGNVLTGVNLSKSSAYAPANADKGSFITFGGGSCYGINVGNPSSYDNDFICGIYNEDSNRSKQTNFSSGHPFFYLEPNQGFILIKDGSGAWATIPAMPMRWLKTGAVLYADIGAGSDSNDGLAPGSGGAKQHIANTVLAMNQRLDSQNASPTINVANGSYPEQVNCAGPNFANSVFFLTGASPAVTLVSQAGGPNACLTMGDGATGEITNLALNGTGVANGFGISIHQDAILDVLTGCSFVGNWNGGQHMGMDHGGGSLNLDGSYTVSAGGSLHLGIGGACSVSQNASTVTISGSPTISKWYQAIGSGANIAMATVTFSGSPAVGCIQYLAALNASISAGGSTLPGSISGSTTTGGQFSP